MTKIKNNALLQSISGKMGDTHTYRKMRGKMHMVNLPATGKLTDHQKAVSSRFLKASNYAKAALLDPIANAEYELGITAKKNSAYIVAVSDSLNAPKVNEIKASDYQGAIGDVIKIDATDDFKVVRVRVIILGSDGKKLEQGEASQDTKNAHIWKYIATVTNPTVPGSTISVTAFDMPDNETTLESVL